MGRLRGRYATVFQGRTHKAAAAAGRTGPCPTSLSLSLSLAEEKYGLAIKLVRSSFLFFSFLAHCLGLRPSLHCRAEIFPPPPPRSRTSIISPPFFEITSNFHRSSSFVVPFYSLLLLSFFLLFPVHRTRMMRSLQFRVVPQKLRASFGSVYRESPAPGGFAL